MLGYNSGHPCALARTFAHNGHNTHVSAVCSVCSASNNTALVSCLRRMWRRNTSTPACVALANRAPIAPTILLDALATWGPYNRDTSCEAHPSEAPTIQWEASTLHQAIKHPALGFR